VIRASEVSALLGRNPYKCADEAYLDLLSHSREFGMLVLEARNSLGAISADELLCNATDFIPELKVSMAATVAKAAASTTPQALQAVMESAQSAAAVGFKAFANGNIEAERSLQKLLTQRLLMDRGAVLEGSSLDEMERTGRARVAQRNDKCYSIDYGSFVLVGRVDGIREATQNTPRTIIEIKHRRSKRFLSREPPERDIIQIWCYLRLLKDEGVTEAELREEAPGGEVRTTGVRLDDASFRRVESALDELARRFASTTPNDVLLLIERIYGRLPAARGAVRARVQGGLSHPCPLHRNVNHRVSCDHCGSPGPGVFFSCRPCDFDACFSCHSSLPCYAVPAAVATNTTTAQTDTATAAAAAATTSFAPTKAAAS
jgi:hypothetical protein